MAYLGRPKRLCGLRLAILILRNRFFESHGIPVELEPQQASVGSFLDRVQDTHQNCHEIVKLRKKGCFRIPYLGLEPCRKRML